MTWKLGIHQKWRILKQIHSVLVSTWKKRKFFWLDWNIWFQHFLEWHVLCWFFFSFQNDFLSHFSIKNNINMRMKWFFLSQNQLLIDFYHVIYFIFLSTRQFAAILECFFPLQMRKTIWNHKTASFGIGGERQRGNPIPPASRFWLWIFLPFFIYLFSKDNSLGYTQKLKRWFFL